MFSVLMHGGIGDTLRNLSIFPHGNIYKLTGIRTLTYYKHWRITGEHKYANPPGTDFFHEMADRFESLKWGGEATDHRGPGAYANRLVRELVKISNGGRPRYFALEPKLSDAERAELPDLGNDLVIGVQTHLLGVWTKCWGLENWQRFLSLLCIRYPNARVVVLEPSPEADKLVVAPGIITTHQLNLYQMLDLFRRFNFAISIDSWAKYAAAWNQCPQIVICPDQRPEFPDVSADLLINMHFVGIFGEPRNRTIGLELDNKGRGLVTLDLITSLTPEALLRETEEQLSKFPRRRTAPASGRRSNE